MLLTLNSCCCGAGFDNKTMASFTNICVESFLLWTKNEFVHKIWVDMKQQPCGSSYNLRTKETRLHPGEEEKLVMI